MKKMTLLEIVQNILSAMDSDEVNSISDTIESMQVAEVVKETYYEQFTNPQEKELKKLIKIDDAGILASPNYLELQEDVIILDWLKYKDTRNEDKYKDVTYVLPEEFFEIVLRNKSTDNDVTSTLDPVSGVTYYIKNNICPTYFTILNTNYIVTDSYDATYEDTLHQAKTVAFGYVAPDFELVDTFTPELDPKKFPLLLAEAKSTCFINFKQISSSKEEQRARRQRVRLNNDRDRFSGHSKRERRVKHDYSWR